jgi:hypothetical protein
MFILNGSEFMILTHFFVYESMVLTAILLYNWHWSSKVIGSCKGKML